MSLSSMPIEICLHIACFLSDNELPAFLHTLPCLKEHVNDTDLFCPWRRRRISFSYKLQRSLLNDRIDGRGLNVALSKHIQEFGFQENRQLQVEDVFGCLVYNLSSGAQSLRLRQLLGTTRTNMSIDAAKYTLEMKFAPMEVVLAMVPEEALISGTMQIYIWLTAYLLYTSLTPKDVICSLSYGICPTTKKRVYIYVDPLALAEYFSFLLLFVRLCDIDRQMRNPTAGNRKNIHELLADTGDSALSRQAVFILDRRLQEYLDSFYASDASYNKRPSSRDIQDVNDTKQSFGQATSSQRKVPIYRIKPKEKHHILTMEQNHLVNADIKQGDLFKVRAYAGSGKSSCCVEYARKRPELEILYIAYNKAAKLDADEKFRGCSNVSCRTVHGLARGVLKVVNPKVAERIDGQASPSSTPCGSGLVRSQSGGSMQDLDNVRIGIIDPRDVEFALTLTPESTANIFRNISISPTRIRSRRQANSGNNSATVKYKKASTVSRILVATLNTFCWSSDSEIKPHHLPLALVEKKAMDAECLLSLARKLWSLVLDGAFPVISHDCYLKMLSLNDSVYVNKDAFGQYDIIMFDEAQDANSSICQIILRQTMHCGVILLGDPYQKIYGFRGARNECFDDTSFPPTRTFYLTQSFRFGIGIAKVANCLLRSIGEVVPLQGVAQPALNYVNSANAELPGVFGPCHPTTFDATLADPVISSPVQYTMIFSKNATLIAHCLKYSIRYPNHKICIKASATNPPSKIFMILHEAYGLYHQISKPNHKSLRQFRTFQDIKDWWQAYADSEGDLSDDVDYFLISVIINMEKIIAESTDFDRLLVNCELNLVMTEDDANIVLTTTHQAKGLEWDYVVISNEFPVPMDPIADVCSSQWMRQNISLLYVACTRAKKRLMLSPRLAELVYAHIGSFRTFISPNEGKIPCRACSGFGPQKSYIHTLLWNEGNSQSLFQIEDLQRSSILVGYESMVPACDLSLKTWEIQPNKSLQAPDLDGNSNTQTIACSNCILAWYFLDPTTSSIDLVQFAAYVRKSTLPALTMTDAMRLVNEQYKILSSRPRRTDIQNVNWISIWVWSYNFESGWPFKTTWSKRASAIYTEESKYDDDDLDDYFASEDASIGSF